MKLLLDMDVSPRVAIVLGERGHEVVHVVDLGRGAAPDHELLALALERDTIFVTHDLDFGALLAASGARLPSVITLRLRDMRPDPVAALLARILDVHAEPLSTGSLVTVTEAAVRVRQLPIRGAPDAPGPDA